MGDKAKDKGERSRAFGGEEGWSSLSVEVSGYQEGSTQSGRSWRSLHLPGSCCGAAGFWVAVDSTRNLLSVFTAGGGILSAQCSLSG